MPPKFDFISVLDGLDEPLAVVDRAGVIVYANREFERACGAQGSPVNRTVGDAWPDMDRVTAHATYLHGRASGIAVCFNYVCRLGTRYEIAVQPIDDTCSSMVFRKLNDPPGTPPKVQIASEDPHPYAALHVGMLADMGACLRAELSAAETFYQVALILGRLPDVSRATFGTVDNEARTVTIHQDFFRDAPSMEGVYPVRDTEITSQELARGQIVVIEDVRTDYHSQDNPELRFKRGYLACVDNSHASQRGVGGNADGAISGAAGLVPGRGGIDPHRCRADLDGGGKHSPSAGGAAGECGQGSVPGNAVPRVAHTAHAGCDGTQRSQSQPRDPR